MPVTNIPVIDMQGVCKHYLLGSGIATPILKSIDLTIEKGEYVSIMGPSGSGKSTLMNLLGMLDRPNAGTYKLAGEDIRGYSDAKLSSLRNRAIGFVFQGFNLLPRRSVIDNIALPLLYAGQERDERMEKAAHYLGEVGLSSHRDYLPTQLSGGQQQRIAIARALATEPELILADEPTGNLDSQTGEEIMALFGELNRKGITIVLVTHEPDIAGYTSRLVRLRDGEIVYDGPIE